jgi:hypothetical protein
MTNPRQLVAKMSPDVHTLSAGPASDRSSLRHWLGL